MVEKLAARAVVRFGHVLLVVHFELLPVAGQMVLEAASLPLLPLAAS